MKFTFTDKKVNIPNRVHAYAEKKISKLERYFRSEPEANVVFSVEKGRNNLEVTIRSGSTIRFRRSAFSYSGCLFTTGSIEEKTSSTVWTNSGSFAYFSRTFANTLST